MTMSVAFCLFFVSNLGLTAVTYLYLLNGGLISQLNYRKGFFLKIVILFHRCGSESWSIRMEFFFRIRTMSLYRKIIQISPYQYFLVQSFQFCFLGFLKVYFNVKRKSNICLFSGFESREEPDPSENNLEPR